MASNFTFVQSTPHTLTGALSQAFGSATTAGNFIIVVVFAPFGGLTDTSGASGDVTDNQGNQYYAIQQGIFPAYIGIYATVNIKGGAVTVTAPTIGQGGIYAAEYNSATLPFYICPGSCAEPFSLTATIGNNNTTWRNLGGPDFLSTEECMVVWGRGVTGAIVTWTAVTGTIHLAGNMPADGVTGIAAGDDDVGSVNPTYSDLITSDRFGNDGYAVCVFLNLTTGTCTNGLSAQPPFISCGGADSATIGIAYSHEFPSGSGAPPYTYAITAGSLPPGLSINDSGTTCTCTGTATTAGTYPFTIQVTDTANHSVHVDCSIEVVPVVSIWCGNPVSALIGDEYSATIPVSGGAPPYTFSITSGTLPPGLTLDASTGIISGVATGIGFTCTAIIHFDETTHNDQGAAMVNFWESGLARGIGELTSMLIRVSGMIAWMRGTGACDVTIWGPDHTRSVTPQLLKTQGVPTTLSPKPGLSYMTSFDISQIENFTVQVGTSTIDAWVEISMLQPLWKPDMFNR